MSVHWSPFPDNFRKACLAIELDKGARQGQRWCQIQSVAALQVRAAVPMYLLARKIKALGFKVVLSGEGADEIYGGYLYFHKAPSPEEFHR